MARSLSSQGFTAEWARSSSQHDADDVVKWLVHALHESPHASILEKFQIADLLKVRTSTEWVCDECKSISTSQIVPETGLSLPIEGRGVTENGRLDDCIREYFRNNTLPGVVCENKMCNSKRDRKQHYMVHSTPEILFIQLKRFATRYDGSRKRSISYKVNKKIAIDRFLDLRPYVDQHGHTQARYEIAASILHSGSLQAGHYITIARGKQGKVNCFDDSTVSESSERALVEGIKSFVPYILMYTKCRK